MSDFNENNTHSMFESDVYKKIIKQEELLCELRNNVKNLYMELVSEYANSIKNTYNIDNNVKLKCIRLYNGYDDNGDILHIIKLINENNNKTYMNYEYYICGHSIEIIDSFLCESDDDELKLDFFNELDTIISWDNICITY